MTNAAALPSSLLDVFRAFPESAKALIKVHKAAGEGEGRYSPAEVASVEVVPAMGQPDPNRICTSIVERQNLTISMRMRRLTRQRLSARSGKTCGPRTACTSLITTSAGHKTLRIMSAMESKLTDHVWDLAELLR